MCPAPYPLSILTTATPGAQALSIDSSGARPPNAAPYPTDVGTATTGALTRPATTLGSAPSIPAATTITRARRSRSKWASTRCSPATPTSMTKSVGLPRYRAVISASLATRRSEVPAASTTTRPPLGAGGSAGQATISASGTYSASGSAARTASACSGVARVNSVGVAASLTLAAIRPTWSAVLGSHSTASGYPRRAPRSWSRLATRCRSGPGCQVPSSIDRYQRQSEGPGLDPAQIQCGEPEPRLAHHPVHLGALLHGGHQFVVGQLDTGHIAVVANPAVTESESAQSALGLIHLAQFLRCDLFEVGDAGGQARSGGLVRNRQLQGPGHFAHHRFGHPGLSQRPEHPMVRGRLGAGPVGAFGVVGVLPVRHRHQTEFLDQVLRDAGEQFVLAVEAAVRPVGAVGLRGTLMGLDLHHWCADHRRGPVCRLPLIGGQARGHSQDRGDVLCSQGAHGQRQESGRVHPAGVGHAQRDMALEPLHGCGGRLRLRAL